jgi:hypothetical protein
MATRTCSSCQKNLPKSEYSKNQWAKKDVSKCKGCVDGGNTNPEPTSAPVAKKEELVSIGVVNVAGDDAAAAAASE